MYVDNTHSVFMDILKMLNNMCNCFWKWNFEFCGTKSEISQIRMLILQNFQFYAVWRFQLRFTSELKILAAFQHLHFLPKMAKHDVAKTPFSQKNLDRFFSEILMADVKLMLGRVLKVSRRYLPPVFSYRENPAGGRICPPPSGARVNWCCKLLQKYQLCAKNSHVRN